MRGRVIKFEESTAQISGDDGHRYQLALTDSARDERLSLIGCAIDFVPSGDIATNVVLVEKSPQEKSKVVAASLAFLFGVFGIDRFYIGRNSSGKTILTIFLATLIGNQLLNNTPIFDYNAGNSNLMWKGNIQNFIWLIGIFCAICRAIAYLRKSDEQFFESYLSSMARRESV